MKLYYYCSACTKENNFNTAATNRFELQEERGNDIKERCTHCGTMVNRRINRVHAKANNIWIIAAIGIAVVATVALWRLGWMASITFAFPFLVWQYLKNEASKFNKIMVDDK